MSLSPMISAIPRPHKSVSDGVTISGVEDEAQPFLDVLSSAKCRTILDVTSADALTASEISDECDLPLSTTYRKINMLTATGLLEKKIRFSQSGRYASEYTRSVDEIVISFGD